VRNLILTGGIRHDFEDNTEALAGQLFDVGFQCEAETDIEAGIRSIASEAFDLVTVMALRWRMLGDEKYAQYREEWALSLSSESREILHGYVSSGGGLFGFHTACLCFDDWPEWRDILGGVWDWGRSSHPPYGPVDVTLTDHCHPLTSGITPFELEDEVYGELSTVGSIEPLLTASSRMGGAQQPVLWTHSYGHGRVVFDALGHDRASIDHAQHSLVIKRSALWAAKCDVH